MDDLIAMKARTHFAPYPHPPPGLHLAFLIRIEMQPSQRQSPGAVRHDRHQLSARAQLYFTVQDLAFYLDRLSGQCGTDVRDACFVLVSERQVDDEIGRLSEAQPLALTFQGRSGPALAVRGRGALFLHRSALMPSLFR